MSKAAELSTSKVVAGGMAAATSAVLGSHFGALGAVGGAAVGSVVTTVGTTVYQRSLEHARSRVITRSPIPVGKGGPPPDASTIPLETVGTTPAGPAGDAPPAAEPGAAAAGEPGAAAGEPGAAAGEPGAAAPAGPVPARRWLWTLVIGTLLVFGLGLSLVTGVEWAKGSPLSGGPGGTSIGAVLEPAPAPAEDAEGSTGTEDRDADRADREDIGRDGAGTDPTSSDRAPLPPARPVPSAVPGPVPSLPLPTPPGGADGSGSGSGGSDRSDSGGSDGSDSDDSAG